jgi:hypothetical protein
MPNDVLWLDASKSQEVTKPIIGVRDSAFFDCKFYRGERLDFFSKPAELYENCFHQFVSNRRVDTIERIDQLTLLITVKSKGVRDSTFFVESRLNSSKISGAKQLSGQVAERRYASCNSKLAAMITLMR